MKLCTPEIRGPVSAWSTTLVVRQAIPGATVTVSEGGPGGVPVFKGGATAQVFAAPLGAGVKLTPGAKLFLSQELGPESSEWTDAASAVVVGSAPTDFDQLPPFHCRTRLYPGGSAVMLEGAFAGAEIVARVGAFELGRGAAIESWARLRLVVPVPLGGSVTFEQRAPAGFPALTGQPPLPLAVDVLPPPVPLGFPLPPPAFRDPMPSAGATAFMVTEAIDGAVVTMQRSSDGSSTEYAAYRDELPLLAVPPFACEGDVVELTQRLMLGDELKASAPVELAFGAPPQPAQPAPHRSCGGATGLVVDGIESGAEVMLQVTAPGYVETYRGIGDPTIGSPHQQTFQIGAIPADAQIRVWQTRCGLQSPYGETTADRAHALTAPVVVGPLFHCARAVRVSRIAPGSLVRLWARTPFGEISLNDGWRFSPDDTLQILVTPHLVADWLVFAEQLSCSGPSLFSEDPVRVEPAPLLPPVEFVRSPIDSETLVRVKAVPGASVEIRSGSPLGEVIGEGVIDPEEDRVPLSRPLVEGETVVGLQTLCPDREPRRGAVGVEVMPSTKVFTLDKKKTWPVGSEGVGKDVIWKSATLVCRFAGDYTFQAELEIKAQKSSAMADVRVEIKVAGFQTFSLARLVALVADNPDIQEDDVLRAQGFASPAKVLVPGPFAPFSDPDYWLALLSSQAKFTWLVALSKLVGVPKVDDAKPPKRGDQRVGPPYP